MGYEHEMEEYNDEIITKYRERPYLKFHDNKIDCRNVDIKTIIWGYICWVLAGKPQNREDILD